MKTKKNLNRFRGTYGTLNFEEKAFFNTVSGFTPNWGYEPTNALLADCPGVYIS